MSNKLFLFGLLLFCFLCFNAAKASHIAGHTTCYEYIGFDTASGKYLYLIQTKIYRDPSGIGLPLNLNFNVFHNDSSYTSYTTFSIPRVYIDTVTVAPYVCTYDPNIADSIIYQEGIYLDTVAIDSSSIGYYLVASSCCRNGGVLNINTGGTTFHIYIPPTSFENSSPCFTDPITPLICENYTVNFSNIFDEPDGDSLHYAFVVPYRGNASPPFAIEDYKPGYSLTEPFGPGSTATIDSVTGVATILAPSQGLYVIAIELNEYRNSVLMSVTRKEMQIVVDSCTVVYSDCVWPGDANSDGIVNNVDLLNIGIGFGSKGPGRPGASLDWYAQNAPDWVDTFSNGINYKNADCNGDSTINDDDTTAILLNYGNVHSKRSINKAGGPDDPPLYVKFQDDSIEIGGTATVLIGFGSASINVDTAYGIALSVNYDPMLIDSGTVYANYGNSWMGTVGTDLTAISKDLFDDAKFDIGITKTDGANAAGFGEIAQVQLNIRDDLNGDETLVIDISNVIMIDNMENSVDFNLQGGDSIKIYKIPSGVTDKEDLYEMIKVYPNPTDQMVYVELGSAVVDLIRITNIIGREVYVSSDISSSLVQVDVSNLAEGMYFMFLLSDLGTAVQKISILR